MQFLKRQKELFGKSFFLQLKARQHKKIQQKYHRNSLEHARERERVFKKLKM